jgi:hypothetical protein
MQILEDAGLEPAAAILRLRQESRNYDPSVLRTIEILFADPRIAACDNLEECMVENLVSGLVLAADAMSDEDVSLIAAGTELTPLLIERLRGFAELGSVRQPLCIVRPARVELAG